MKIGGWNLRLPTIPLTVLSLLRSSPVRHGAGNWNMFRKSCRASLSLVSVPTTGLERSNLNKIFTL
jgi:hypothetical protein